MRKAILLLGAIVLFAPMLESQRAPRAPRRPRLAAGADTNDANAYLNLGNRTVEDNPTAAADAFYWAVRLDPSSADALYGLRTANLMRRPSSFIRYMQGQRQTVFSTEMRANDSLYLRALWIDPFFHPRHERSIQFAYFRTLTGSAGEMDFAVEALLNRAGPATRALVAVGMGQMQYALDLYTQAIEASREPAYLYVARGGVNAMQGFNDAAIADYEVALVELRKPDATKDSIVIFYSSKALYEHSVGLLNARKGDAVKAREALGRAMEEDLSFYPSHLALAQLALAAKDTATAISEASLAAELAPLEAHVHVRQGEILLRAGQHAEAIGPLRKAISLEPFYASPHYLLGQALERTSDPGAKETYQKFLTLAPRRDPRRAEVTRRIAALGGGTQ